MAQIVIYAYPTAVGIEFPAGEITPEQAQQLAGEKAWKIVDDSVIPVDRTFRPAWRCSFEGNVPNGIEINLEHAKLIWRALWQEKADPVLLALNNQYVAALVDADEDAQASIASQRQAILAGLETDLSSVETIEDLKALWPESLPR